MGEGKQLPLAEALPRDFSAGEDNSRAKDPDLELRGVSVGEERESLAGPKPWYKRTKFWMAVTGIVTGVLAAYSPELEEPAKLIIAAIAAYIIGEAYVDGQAACR